MMGQSGFIRMETVLNCLKYYRVMIMQLIVYNLLIISICFQEDWIITLEVGI